MTDQELADAIRERFADHIRPTMTDGQYLHFGTIVLNFCDEHQAWAPTPGGRAYWTTRACNVWVVGPYPTNPNDWVILTDETMIAHWSNLKPPRPDQ